MYMYVISASVVACASSRRDGDGTPRDRNVFSAYIDEKHDPNNTYDMDEDSFLLSVIPIEVTLFVLVTDC